MVTSIHTRGTETQDTPISRFIVDNHHNDEFAIPSFLLHLYTEEMVPWHPCLKLISNCEQKLSSHTSRRLITMEKVKEFEEIKSLLSLFGGQFISSQETYGKSPFWILSIPSEDIARNLMKRTVCAKSIFELWGHGKCPEELYSSLKNYPVEKMVPFLHSDSTYKIKIHTFNKTLTQEEKVKRIDALEFLPFEGKVNLKKPQHVFSILEDYGLDPNHIPENPHNIYFGRWIADGQRELIESYSVKKRHFIGNTSMDAGLSFIMANHGKVKKNDIVFDPFVGTAMYSKLGLLKAHSNQMDKVLFKEAQESFSVPLDN